ncbi:uncharacterized protein LOC100571498 [Acyrthosiphon pisum]|uniref:Uncharacterized protein n=1 Tax=Acyrthosiphon pisum TaxID=7029 RepID=A0A8R2AF44_ACYPI|nr:uncharacterized protein LOC100571498 [Acyrthosiphon pisum]|eukprot:XP_003247225.1 PREDICTED: uncharacterized protein LOC100571498 [Acyrthosiphon pisum]
MSFRKFFLRDNGKHRNMDSGGKNDESTTNKDEAKQGQHDAHKHHDIMGEIVLGQELPDNVKDNHNGVDLVDNQVKEVNPHSESLDTYQIDEYDDYMDEDINIITATLDI